MRDGRQVKKGERDYQVTYAQVDLALLQPLHVYRVDHVRHLVELCSRVMVLHNVVDPVRTAKSSTIKPTRAIVLARASWLASSSCATRQLWIA